MLVLCVFGLRLQQCLNGKLIHLYPRDGVEANLSLFLDTDRDVGIGVVPVNERQREKFPQVSAICRADAAFGDLI